MASGRWRSHIFTARVRFMGRRFDGGLRGRDLATSLSSGERIVPVGSAGQRVQSGYLGNGTRPGHGSQP
jgi:hypothetical protein